VIEAADVRRWRQLNEVRARAGLMLFGNRVAWPGIRADDRTSRSGAPLRGHIKKEQDNDIGTFQKVDAVSGG
jgi:hypothetical protein